jgi:hypothetical protein
VVEPRSMAWRVSSAIRLTSARDGFVRFGVGGVADVGGVGVGGARVGDGGSIESRRH